MSIIDEQNVAFIQSLEEDLMKEIARIDDACTCKSEPKSETLEPPEMKPTLEELRKLRTHFFNKQNII